MDVRRRGTDKREREEEDLQAVPVRPRPRMRTFMGTVRRHSRRLMSVSLVKMSVMGRGVYLAENAIVKMLEIESDSNDWKLKMNDCVYVGKSCVRKEDKMRGDPHLEVHRKEIKLCLSPTVFSSLVYCQDSQRGDDLLSRLFIVGGREMGGGKQPTESPVLATLWLNQEALASSINFQTHS